MDIFACSHQDDLVFVTKEEGQGIYECPKCPLTEWRECYHCHQINICLPSISLLCTTCVNEGRSFVISYGKEGKGNAEEAITARMTPYIHAFRQVGSLKARARKRLGLPAKSRVPRKIEDICAKRLRGMGILYINGWYLPGSSHLAMSTFRLSSRY